VTERKFFVYRIFDNDGALLYVGCTNRPYTRWAEHRAERPWIARRAATFKMQGPFTRSVARAIERAALKAECPLFGLTPAKQSAITRAYAWTDRRTRELQQGGWDFATAAKLAANEAKHRFPGVPTSYADLRHPWEMQA
jgi:predicted GIY-YIG superfamily endonuclease